MAYGVVRWRIFLAQWSAQVAQVSWIGSNATLCVHKPLAPAVWRDYLARCREAVELLHALTVIEQCSWREMMESLRFQELDHWGYEPRQSASFVPLGSLRIWVPPIAVNEPSADIYSAFFLGFDEHSVRAEFRDMMQLIYSGLTREERQRLDEQHNQIPVNFTLSVDRGSRSTPVPTCLRSFSDLVRRIAEQAVTHSARPRDDGRWHYRFPFAMTSVELGIHSIPLQEPGALAALVALFGLGVRSTRTIDIAADSWFVLCPIPDIAPVLQCFTDEASFCASSNVEQLVFGPSLPDLRLSSFSNSSMSGVDERFLVRQFGALASALSTTREIESLVLCLHFNDISPECSDRLMKWLVYALFSKDSTSSFSSMKISGSLFTGRSTAIASVLGARNPARALLDTTTEAVSEQERIGHQEEGSGEVLAHRAGSSITGIDMDDGDQDLGFAVLDAGTRIMIKPLTPLSSSRSSRMESFELKQEGRFRVMQDVKDDDWVDIVVPCFGHCLVARSSINHIEQATTPESSYSAGYGGSITSLWSGVLDIQALHSLVSFVGSKLLWLAIQTVIPGNDLREILRSCPNLVTLKIEYGDGLADMVLVEAYETRSCKIEDLEVFGINGNEDNAPFINLTRALQDPQSSATKSIRRLCFASRRIRFSPRALIAYGSMLAANQKITCFELLMGGRLPYLKSWLTETRDRWLCDCPLSPSSRYAFLSVIWDFRASSTTESRRTRSQQLQPSREFAFDQPILLLIFDFAAQGTRREITINGLP